MSSTKKNSGKRIANDYYPTPSWCVDRLLDYLPMPKGYPMAPSGKWLEPGAGDGNIIKAVNARMSPAPTWTAVELQQSFKSDLEGLAEDVRIENYLESNIEPREHNVIITNPPFSLALEFIKKSIELRPEYVCMLLRLNFMGSSERSSYLRRFAPDVYVIPNRPSFNGKGNDSIEYAWFVWERQKGYGGYGTGMIRILGDTPKHLRKKK